MCMYVNFMIFYCPSSKCPLISIHGSGKFGNKLQSNTLSFGVSNYISPQPSIGSVDLCCANAVPSEVFNFHLISSKFNWEPSQVISEICGRGYRTCLALRSNIKLMEICGRGVRTCLALRSNKAKSSERSAVGVSETCLALRSNSQQRQVKSSSRSSHLVYFGKSLIANSESLNYIQF